MLVSWEAGRDLGLRNWAMEVERQLEAGHGHGGPAEGPRPPEHVGRCVTTRWMAWYLEMGGRQTAQEQSPESSLYHLLPIRKVMNPSSGDWPITEPQFLSHLNVCIYLI